MPLPLYYYPGVIESLDTDFGDLNSDPHACMSELLPVKPFSQPILATFKAESLSCVYPACSVYSSLSDACPASTSWLFSTCWEWRGKQASLETQLLILQGVYSEMGHHGEFIVVSWRVFHVYAALSLPSMTQLQVSSSFRSLGWS